MDTCKFFIKNIACVIRRNQIMYEFSIDSLHWTGESATTNVPDEREQYEFNRIIEDARTYYACGAAGDIDNVNVRNDNCGEDGEGEACDILVYRSIDVLDGAFESLHNQLCAATVTRSFALTRIRNGGDDEHSNGVKSNDDGNDDEPTESVPDRNEPVSNAFEIA